MRHLCAIIATTLLAGSAFADTINVPADYPTIQQAVDASIANDVIEVASSHYETGSVLVPHNLTIQCSAPKGQNPIITLTSPDNQLLGAVAAKIRSLRKPEPYKGKGIKFVGEQLRRKAGKTAAS